MYSFYKEDIMLHQENSDWNILQNIQSEGVPYLAWNSAEKRPYPAIFTFSQELFEAFETDPALAKEYRSYIEYGIALNLNFKIRKAHMDENQLYQEYSKLILAWRSLVARNSIREDVKAELQLLSNCERYMELKNDNIADLIEKHLGKRLRSAYTSSEQQDIAASLWDHTLTCMRVE